MNTLVKVAFASGTDELNRKLVRRMAELFPELPLYVVSEFPPEQGQWIPYRVNRGLLENLARCRAALAGRSIRLAGALLVPNVPFRRLRLMPLLLAPHRFVAFNECLDSFMLRPGHLPVIVRHFLWRAKNLVRFELRPGGHVYTWLWRMRHPREWRLPLLYRAALLARRHARSREVPLPRRAGEPGITVVIPSRNGRHLLEAHLPGVVRELAGFDAEIAVVDNGSQDGTAEFLARAFPSVVVESSDAPLSFAAAVNRGIRRARYSHVCLLNNDMALEPGFFAPLVKAFAAIPNLFCATAQILFPAGVRREETGKAVFAPSGPRDFPVRCEEPLEGEDLSWVLYGSGGCSLYCASKLRALGAVNEAYAPAYVEDLDLGYRAWQQGWPSVFVAGARVEHQHRATTSRYYTDDELSRILEINWLRFLTTAVASPKLFRAMWRAAAMRLRLLGRADVLDQARHMPAAVERVPRVEYAEELFLALGSGKVAVFPGRGPRSKPAVVVASPYVPFPLSHGGAVRIYNLMRRAARDFDQVLVAFTERLAPPPAELLEICAEVVLVERQGSHSPPPSRNPETVEEFRSSAFRAALQQTVRKWRPRVAQLEFTQMAQYARDCAPARTVLVEHDITFDLYQQLARKTGDWETRRQLRRWRRFEPAAWRSVNRVVTMSERDRRRVEGAQALALPNGVDLERFQPSGHPPEPRRLLFIGSFAHLPNAMAAGFFLNEAWPLLEDVTLHIIAGARHEQYLHNCGADLARPGVEIEGFVADVRPAYERAAVVIAPLVASAGTNIKILEAMAMAKAVVTTPAGINGLDVENEVVLVRDAKAMAEAIRTLLAEPARREDLEQRARRRVERDFGWDAIARRQKRLYDELIGG